MSYHFTNWDGRGAHQICTRYDQDKSLNQESLHLLFVDDSSDVRDALQAAVSTDGFTVSTVASGSEAIGFINDSDSGNLIVLTDYSMPGLNGLELIHAMRVQGHDHVVVLCSGDVASIDWSKCVHYPSCVIEKPFNFRKLRSLLYQLCLPAN